MFIYLLGKITVNNLRYCNMLTNFLWPRLDGMNVGGVICFLAVLFRARQKLISHQDRAIWTFFWGEGRVLKGKLYANNPHTIPEHKTEIIDLIQPRLFQGVKFCLDRHLSYIVFHNLHIHILY